jgi:hypothetical protein
MILWQWLPRRDEWVYATKGADGDDETSVNSRRAVLRGFKRREPRGTRFKWSNAEPRRFRPRVKKEK